MEGCCFGEPDVAVDSGAFVEPTVAIAGVDAYCQNVARTIVYEVADVETEWRVAVVMSSNECAIDEYERGTNDAIELEHYSATGVGGGNVETAPVPAD